MRLQFTNPCPNGESLGSLNKSKVKYSTEKGNSIVSPYDGVVTKVGSNSITITHNINGKEWESELSGFNPIVSVKQRVNNGKHIGYTKNGTFSFEVSPSINLKDALSHGFNTLGYNGKSNKEKKEYHSNDDSVDGMYKIMLSPLSFIRGALNLDKKDSVSEQELNEKTTLIKEDIDRIKKLF